MDNLLEFFIEAGKLGRVARRGWVLIGEKNPASVVDHTFRTTIMAWVLASAKKMNLNIERVLKMALAHDLCEIYAGDLTPYDFHSILPKDKKKWPKIFDKWPRPSGSKKIKGNTEKHKKEKEALLKLVSHLPPHLKKEIFNLWLDYEYGSTKEGRFVKQVNRTETLLQALEYGQKSNKQAYKSWWIGTEELVDDPVLLELMDKLAKKFHKRK